MSAETLRRAASLMRERAEAAVLSPWHAVEGASGGWWVEHPNTADIALDLHGENARHIASWHPAVALAVADWLDEAADHLAVDESDDVLTHICPTALEGMECSVLGQALTVARAYLGESA